ncbi:MAG: DUF2848 family protein [Nitrospinae bacterium]|nr:DUF2848 family protein [Nitrospinota bacterium]
MERGKLTLTNSVDGQQIGFQPRHLILGGYTGRDREHVQRHIDELVAAGIPAPASVPELYPGHAAAIQIGGVLPAGSGWSSGEVEYVLFVTAQGVYVGVGSDHTDRALERTSIVAAKQAFPMTIKEIFRRRNRSAVRSAGGEDGETGI